jgi:hypothetical protein
MAGARGGDTTCYRIATAAITLAILAVGIRAAHNGWLPTGDQGFYALRAHDVFSDHPPLRGMASSVSIGTGAEVSHPGPLQFDLLAVPVALLGIGAGTAVGVAGLNALSVATLGWLIRRRAGPLAGTAAVVAVGGLAWAMGSALLFDPWGPYMAMLPFALFLVAVAMAAGGDLVALPIAVVAGSVALQAHSSYAALVPGLTLVAVAGAGYWLRRDRRADRAAWLWVGVTVMTAVVCWAQPLYQQLTGDPGNLTAWFRSTNEIPPETVGLGDSVVATASITGHPPWWWPPGFAEPYRFVQHFPDSAHLPLAVLTLGLLVAAHLWAIWNGRGRDDRVVLGASATALAALVLALGTVLRAPAYGVAFPTYVRFLWPVAFWTWCSLGLAVVRAGVRPWQRARLPAALALASVVVGLSILPHVDHARPVRAVEQANAAEVRDAVLDAVDGRTPVLLHQTMSQASYSYLPLLMAALAEHDVPFLVDDEVLVQQVGEHRRLTRDRPAAIAIVVFHDANAHFPGGQAIFRRPAPNPSDGVAVFLFEDPDEVYKPSG